MAVEYPSHLEREVFAALRPVLDSLAKQARAGASTERLRWSARALLNSDHMAARLGRLEIAIESYAIREYATELGLSSERIRLVVPQAELAGIREEVRRRLSYVVDRFIDDVTASRLRADGVRLDGLLDPLAAARKRLSGVARRMTTQVRGRTQVAIGRRLGLGQFEWRSKRDNRVRKLHSTLPGGIDGNVYDWSTGHPTEGFPGDPYNCRCSALPVGSLRQQFFPGIALP